MNIGFRATRLFCSPIPCCGPLAFALRWEGSRREFMRLDEREDLRIDRMALVPRL